MTDGPDAAAWTRLTAELDRWPPRGATFWWRDDDAGAAGPAFDRLLALATAHTAPLALAVVPVWLDEAAAALIRDAAPGLRVVQHGYAHRNHEPAAPAGGRGRPAELGTARPVDVVLADLTAGWARLATLVPTRLRAALAPPWNRIAPAVREALPGAGYRVLSTFGPRTATAAGPRALNTHVDPIEWRAGKRFRGMAWTLDQIATHLADRRRDRVDPMEPTGLLTHHRDLTPPAWMALDELLGRLGAHPAVAFPALDRLLDGDAR
ncbi:MAG TPA: polysaccharide deacetylase family protein [Methylomirabilota bacterium]|nr:polysaccharide deacetylase family protein [Methylomirabilota bacterium]